jgi:hypothetical protein
VVKLSGRCYAAFRRKNMRSRIASLAFLVSFASALQAQELGVSPSAAPTPVTPAMIIYRIELVPNGFMFAMNEPVLDGENYVFRSLPERTEMKLPKVKVKSVKRWSGDYSKEVVWQVELGGSSGTHLVRNEPVKKGKNYVAYTWKNNTLVSVPVTDVVKITRLTGRDAFKAEMFALGLVVLEGESMTSGFKGGNAPVNVAPASGSPAPGDPAGHGNWTYQGQPGAYDAYAPSGGTVAKPGDTPMVPTPR